MTGSGLPSTRRTRGEGIIVNTLEDPARVPSSSWLERWSPLGGLLFVALTLFSFLSPSGDGPGDTAEEVVSYANEKSGWNDLALIFALISLILLGWFVSGLYARLRRVEAGGWSVMALVGGVAFTVLFFTAITIWTAPLTELDNETASLQTAQAETYLAIDDVGWVLLGGSGIGAGLMIIAASLVALRARSVPAWAGWIGVALGVISLATIAFVGIFAWLAWLLIASVGMLIPSVKRASGPAATAP
jgi:hypothetical protein